MNTIEEKAKAYDEALEKAREWSETKNGYYMPKELCEEIFPELKESEDKKIRKAIIEGLRVMKSNFHTISSVKIDDAIAWLEKQGEVTDINPSEFDLHLNKLLKQFETLPKEELANSLSFYLNVVQNDRTYVSEENRMNKQQHIAD